MQIELEQIGLNVGQETILDDLNLSIESGQCITISGKSGCGKSLLFSVICGLEQPQSGQVKIDGVDLNGLEQNENLDFRKYLGAVFQRPALISNLSLYENLMLPLNRHFPEWLHKRKVFQVETLAQEFHLTKFLPQRTHLLSAGQAGLAAFSRAIVGEPKCLIWDSPMADVDPRWNQLVKTRLQKLKNEQTTIILFTNREDLIGELADKQYVLDEGKLRFKHAV